jgi:hypothetical protein
MAIAQADIEGARRAIAGHVLRAPMLTTARAYPA